MICDLNVDFGCFYLKIREFRDNFVTLGGLDVVRCRLVSFLESLGCVKGLVNPFLALG